MPFLFFLSTEKNISFSLRFYFLIASWLKAHTYIYGFNTIILLLHTVSPPSINSNQIIMSFKTPTFSLTLLLYYHHIGLILHWFTEVNSSGWIKKNINVHWIGERKKECWKWCWIMEVNISFKCIFWWICSRTTHINVNIKKY